MGPRNCILGFRLTSVFIRWVIRTIQIALFWALAARSVLIGTGISPRTLEILWNSPRWQNGETQSQQQLRHSNSQFCQYTVGCIQNNHKIVDAQAESQILSYLGRMQYSPEKDACVQVCYFIRFTLRILLSYSKRNISWLLLGWWKEHIRCAYRSLDSRRH